MKVWYPNKVDLKTYVETFKVEDRNDLKAILKRGIIDYDEWLFDQKEAQSLLDAHQSFGAFLNFLDRHPITLHLSDNQNELYSFSRWSPSEDDWEWFFHKGYWKEFINSALIECSFCVGSSLVTEPSSYFTTFLLKRYNLELANPLVDLPRHIANHVLNGSTMSLQDLSLKMPYIREAWYAEQPQKPERFFYKYVRIFFPSLMV